MLLGAGYVRERAQGNAPYILFESENADTSLWWGQWKAAWARTDRRQNNKDSERKEEHTFGIQAALESEWKCQSDFNLTEKVYKIFIAPIF